MGLVYYFTRTEDYRSFVEIGRQSKYALFQLHTLKQLQTQSRTTSCHINTFTLTIPVRRLKAELNMVYFMIFTYVTPIIILFKKFYINFTIEYLPVPSKTYERPVSIFTKRLTVSIQLNVFPP